MAWQWTILSGTLLALSYYMRSVGLALIVSGVLWLLLRRRVWDALLVGGVSTILLLPWLVRNRLVLPVAIYDYQFVLKDQENPLAGTVGPLDVLWRVLQNARYYVVAGVVDQPGALVLLAAVLPWVLVLVGWTYFAGRHRGRLLEVYTAVYVALILAWPYASGRFLIPVLPFLGYYGLWGGRLLLQRAFSAEITRPMLVAGTVLLCVPFLLVTARDIRFNLGQWSTDPATYYRFDPAWSAYLQAATWLRHHLTEDDIILARRHFAMGVYSGHLTGKYRYETTPSELEYLLRGTQEKYIVEDAFRGARGDFAGLPPVLTTLGGRLELVHETATDPPVRVWRLVRPEKVEPRT